MGDHETWIFEAANLSFTRRKGMHLAKNVLNTTINVSERENNVTPECRDPYGKQCNIKGGGMARFSTTNGDPHPRVHSCNHYDV